MASSPSIIRSTKTSLPQTPERAQSQASPAPIEGVVALRVRLSSCPEDRHVEPGGRSDVTAADVDDV